MDKEFASLIENGTFSLKPIAEVEQVKHEVHLGPSSSDN
jgi:hypothetical protein